MIEQLLAHATSQGPEGDLPGPLPGRRTRTGDPRDRERRRARSLGRPLCLGLVAVWAAWCLTACQGEQAADPESVAGPFATIPEVGLEAELDPQEVQVKNLELRSGQFVRFEVLQLGTDLEVRLIDPGGELLSRADSPTGPQGPEELVALVERDGLHRLEVEAGARYGTGAYRVETLEARPAEEREVRWVDLDRRFAEARRLRKGGQPDLASPRFSAMVAEWSALGLWHRLAHTLEESCLAEYALGRTSIASAACEEAVSWYRLLGPERRLANTLQITATLFLQLGRLDEAEEILDEVEPIFRRLEHPRGLAMTLVCRAFVESQRGQLGQGLDHLEEAARFAEPLEDSRLSGVIANESGALLLALQRPSQAIDRYRQALLHHQSSKDHSELGLALNGLGRAAVQLGDLEPAEDWIDEALVVALQAGEPRTVLALELNLGNLRRVGGDLVGSRTILEQALAKAQELKLSGVEADLELSLGYTEFLAGQPETSLERLRRAQDLFDRAGVAAGGASARARRAEVLSHLGRADEAWQWLSPALDQIEDLRTGVFRRDHRLSYFGFRQDYFELAREVLLQLRDAQGDGQYSAQALAIEERRRARELLAGIRSGRAFGESRLGRRSPPGEQALERELRTMAQMDPDPEVLERAAGLLATLYRLRSDRRQEQLSRAAEPEVDLRQLQSLLDRETVALIFSLGERSSSLWLLSTEALVDIELPSRRALERLATGFTRALASPTAEDQSLGAELGSGLSRALLVPAREMLARDRWVIVGEGALSRVPFAALPNPIDDGRPVIEGHEVVYIPSLSALRALRERSRSRQPSRRIEIFTDPVFDREDPRMAGVDGVRKDPRSIVESSLTDQSLGRLRDAGVQWERLPASGREGSLLLQRSPELEVYHHTGSAATRSRFLELDSQRIRTLHIATHSILHPEPDLSGLMFSRFDAEGQSLDAFLALIELSQLWIESDLTVLSSCQTVVGTEVRGEGLLSLAWGFLDSGSDRVMASLWKVSDNATADLFEHFYHFYGVEGLPPSAALRQAQRALASQPNRSVFEWAPFVYFGDWQ